jgi:hypothetical protein
MAFGWLPTLPNLPAAFEHPRQGLFVHGDAVDVSVIAAFKAMDGEVIQRLAFEDFHSGVDALDAVSGGEDLDVLGIHDGFDALPDFGEGFPVQTVFYLVDEDDVGSFADDGSIDFDQAVEAFAKKWERDAFGKAYVSMKHSRPIKLQISKRTQIRFYRTRKLNYAVFVGSNAYPEIIGAGKFYCGES